MSSRCCGESTTIASLALSITYITNTSDRTVALWCGLILAYTPSITQAAQLREALADSRFQLAETMEVLNRTWHIEGQAVRPDHRMVAHTGFLTIARKLAPTE